MKAKLEFDIKEPSDDDTFKRAVHADDVFNALWHIREVLYRDISADEKVAEIGDIIAENSWLFDYYR